MYRVRYIPRIEPKRFNRTSRFKGVGQEKETVEVHGLNYIIKKAEAEDRLLIVDDRSDFGARIGIRELGYICL
jgi:hypothetical protein